MAGTTDMGLGPCDDLAQTVASLERHVDRLQEILAEPDLSPAVRLSIIRQIGEAQRTIASLSDALVRCRAPLSIEGVELTQATQYFAFNGQGSGHAPDNSVPLIALRTLVARVYTDSKWVQSLPLPSFPTYVNGRITVDRFNTNGSVTRVADLKPINGPIAARRAATIDRGDPDHTLNFRLAAADCQGLLRFTVVVFEQGPVVSDNVAAGNPRATATQRLDAGTSEPAGPAGIQAAERPSFTVQVYGRFEPVPAFRVRGVLIHYTGDGMDVPAPTGLDFAKTLEFVTKTYPIGRLEFADCVEVEFNGDLSAPGGGCGPGWEGPNGLLGLLANLASGSDDPAIYIALVPRGASSPYTAGCGNTGVAAAFDGAGATLAQEVGHALSRKHAPACGAGGPDPGYPTYDGYPSGSIGEFGFDPFTSDVYDPARYSDFMGYCPDRWVSPYTYMALRDSIVTRFGARARRRLQAGEPPETLFLHFRVHREGAVEVGPGLHLPQVHGTVDQDPPSDVCCELLDRNGSVLVFHRCGQREPNQDPDGPYVDFHEALPWVDEAASIRFLRDRQVLHVHEIEPRTPEIELRSSELQYSEGAVSLEWRARESEDRLTYMVRYSHDGGDSWSAVATNLRDSSCQVQPDMLPGGDRCVVQVVASSGIRTSVTQSEPFAVPRTARKAFILSPEPRMEVSEGDQVLLRGGAFSPDFGLGDAEDAVWTSKLDGALGRGFELVAQDLSPGFHTIELTMPDGVDGVATAQVSLRVTPRERRPGSGSRDVV